MILVDGGSRDRTVERARTVPGVRVLAGPRGRARQMNRGAQAATGDVLLFLHVDVALPEDARARVEAALADPAVVAGAFRTWTMADDRASRLAPLLHLGDLRSRYSGLPYGDQAVFVRAGTFQRIGGFPDQPLMEDLELARRLRTRRADPHRSGAGPGLGPALPRPPALLLPAGQLHAAVLRAGRSGDATGAPVRGSAMTGRSRRSQVRELAFGRGMRRLKVTLMLLALLPPAASAASFSHADWTAVLERFVDDRGRVDFAALDRDRTALDRYLSSLERVSPDSSSALFATRAEQLAYWINAYNAAVVAGVLDRGVETPSVWGDGFFGIGFFTVERARLGGRRMSLKSLEDDIVRARFRDPRVHAALNCASIGCPRLPRRAFEGATLEADLDAAMREFVAEPRNCKVDLAARTVWLSKIFDWFEDDFVGFEKERGTAGSRVIDYVNRYRADGAQIPPGLRVRFLEYDKRLNRQ